MLGNISGLAEQSTSEITYDYYLLDKAEDQAFVLVGLKCSIYV